MFYHLSKHGYDFIKNKISKLNRIADKLEQPRIQFETIKSELITDPETHIAKREYDILCVGVAPSLKDWKFMCELEFTEKGNLFNLTYSSSDADVIIPERFRSTPFTLCEDCGVKRFRTSVFVLHNEKENKWMQVGSTCLGSFLGVNESDVHTLADFASTLANLPTYIKKVISDTENSKKNNSYHGTNLNDLLTYTFANMTSDYNTLIEKCNSHYTRFDINKKLVKVLRSFLYFPKTFWSASVTDNDRQNANKMIDAFKNEYKLSNSIKKTTLDNTIVIMGNDVVAHKHVKFVNYAFQKYLMNDRIYKTYPIEKSNVTMVIKPELLARELIVKPAEPVVEVKIVETPTPAPSNLIPTELHVYNIPLTVKKCKRLVGKFGKFNMVICKSDISPIEYVFSSTKAFYNEDEKLMLKSATVKKESVYNNTKQIYINKVTF